MNEYGGVSFNKERGRLGTVATIILDTGYTPEVTWYYFTTSSLLKGAPSRQQFT